VCGDGVLRKTRSREIAAADRARAARAAHGPRWSEVKVGGAVVKVGVEGRSSRREQQQGGR